MTTTTSVIPELIPKFYSSYNNYLSLTHSNKPQSIVEETSNLVNKNYLFLIFWFILTFIIVLFTIMLIMIKQENSYITYVSLGILIFISFYTFKNIYMYFNVLS
jgi:hypothetical protein